MKTYYIESRVTRYDTIEIKADSRQEAIKKAEQIDGPDWEIGDENPRELISIS